MLAQGVRALRVAGKLAPPMGDNRHRSRSWNQSLNPMHIRPHLSDHYLLALLTPIRHPVVPGTATRTLVQSA